MIAKFSSLVGGYSLPAQRIVIQKKIRKRPKHSLNNMKQLLIDVSVIVHEDAHTGIQRVVRALLLQLFKHPPYGYRIVPVYCTRTHFYRYAEKSFVEQFDLTAEAISIGDVYVSSGDLFFGLDLTAHLLPYHEDELLKWKQQGVKIYMLVYDMLPHLHPQWFTPRSVKNFRRWLRTISIYSDKLICISETVKNELKDWLVCEGFSIHTPRIRTVALGSDISSSVPSIGTTKEIENFLNKFKDKKFVLMVGTVEPRKGYNDALDAMEKLWAEGNDTVLVIVGKSGWKTKSLQRRLLTHPQNGMLFYWLNDVCDQMLQELYKMSLGVLVASHGEGFGLPIVEAMYYGKALLVRDIPVFHEISKEYNGITYFNDSKILILNDWIRRIPIKAIDNPQLITWEESRKNLISIIIPASQTVEDI